LAARITDGSSIAELVDSAKAVVLVYEPFRCYSCSPLVARWEALRDTTDVRLVLVMSQEPDEGEWRTLRRERVPVAGTLARGEWVKDRIPAEYFIAVGKVVDSAVGQSQVLSGRLREAISRNLSGSR
jgi:hypothetical protein